MEAIILDRTNEEYTGTPWTRTELLTAFNIVADKANWKNPILALIPVSTNLEMMTAAVVFFTGSIPTFHGVKDLQNSLVVKARGYYAAVGA